KNAELVVNYCNNAKAMVAVPVDAKIDNIGDGVNSTSSEYVPVISSDESVMIFTYRGDQSVGGLQNAYNQPDPLGVYYEDVFISTKENENWSTPRSIGENINTAAHDAAIALSNDGQKLFIFRDNRYDGGDIYMSTLDGISWSTPEKLRGDINSAAWEGSCALSADEKTLYFSSEKPGGMGGKDLYKASLMPDGTWGKVQNLGNIINTPFDDDAPFIHPDGKTLIYSSKGFNSMGGFDIFKSELNADSSWSQPVNLGYPINTPDEDIYFVLSANGKKGYYASGKKGGFGLQDIYTVDMPEDFITPILAMLKGTITTDDKPCLADITVYYGIQKLEYASIKSNSLSGDYLINLRAGENYTIKYRTDGFEAKEEQLDLTNLRSYLEKDIDVKFYTKKDTIPVADSISLVNTSTQLASNEGKSIEKSTDIGNSSMVGLEFKVQIAAYNLPKNYRYEHLRGLGKVEKLLLDDGITRFTIGGAFNTLNEANAHNQKVRAAGQTDAFVTAIYNGKRVYLEDLEKLGLIPSQK
ncbi:MAG: PD40 domain-containing protein, partial [Bacteroidia bacterium]|nr:PD40 domain-containing protein [Bacteroidia bacterium]